MRSQSPWKPYSSHRDVVLPASRTEPAPNHTQQPRPAKAKRWRMKVVGLLLVVFLIWASVKWWEQQQMLQEMEAELNMLQVKVNEAEERQVELETEINRLHDPEYIAEIARRDYFLSRQGETIFKISD
ncbi:cell division protein DivIC [Caldalkalibacillus uzonensis]|uniref:Cell division protein DivIC n=1 Tax=Caldalkalibacillus uzonensis TaxID=353224 RepID=A0ABU0CXK3_9BACI|nr:septum formation initiator family protein [Caldalkalibacillus uzonensis]MDQ0340650.1 cell division protein DivIC [Caldalkalibacillus uzonensis]